MNCANVKSVLIDLLYGELADVESATVREHLAACPACCQEFARLEKSRQQLSQVAEQPMRINLARLCLRGADRWEQSRRRWRRAGYLTAAALVLIGVFVARQVRCEFRAGQVLIAWRNVAPQALPPKAPPVPEPALHATDHLAAADYLRLRTRVLNQGLDATFKLKPPSEESSAAPRSYRALRDQLLDAAREADARPSGSGV
jgi:hypothetical protein